MTQLNNPLLDETTVKPLFFCLTHLSYSATTFRLLGFGSDTTYLRPWPRISRYPTQEANLFGGGTYHTYERK